MEDPDDSTAVYDDDFGFNEAGVATELFQSRIAYCKCWSTPKFVRKKMEPFLLQKVAHWETDKAVT
jgi:hypothetical protein